MNLLSEEKSLPQKISEDIITLILEENLQPGDKLPNETILSERLNAGRSSVREAMKIVKESRRSYAKGYRIPYGYRFKQQKCCSSKTGSCDQQLNSSLCRNHRRCTAGRNHRDSP